MNRTRNALVALLAVVLTSLALALNNADLVPSIDEGASSGAVLTSEQQLLQMLDGLGVIVT